MWQEQKEGHVTLTKTVSQRLVSPDRGTTRPLLLLISFLTSELTTVKIRDKERRAGGVEGEVRKRNTVIPDFTGYVCA